VARAQLDELQGERINIKLLTDEEKATYRRAKSLAADRGLTIKNYTLFLYREDDKREKSKKK
jgi:hypothetical protein